MANATMASGLPPLPDFTLHPLPSVVPGIPDKYLTLALPVIAYWGVSMFFHLIDVWDLFPQYRLHTPVELVQRNHVSRYEVFRDVVLQHIIQTVFGVGLAWFDPEPTFGKEDYDVAVWAQRIRLAEKAIPFALGAIGFNASAFAKDLAQSRPMLAGALAGGNYPWLTQEIVSGGQLATAPAFASWEISLAKFVYWVAIPAIQFVVAVLVVDTWQYFWHRAMHLNKWLYTTFHSRHHRLYVPYAYGALYNHPFEGFLLDTLGTGIAYLVTGMSIRQSMWFFTGSTIKTVDDHCGYEFPFDPLQLITSNNAAYHDIHHQSWGIKTNFSQPFFTFWDRFLGTMWTGGDVTQKYERGRKAAEKKAEIEVRKPQFLPPDLQSDSASASEATSEVESAKEQPQPALRRSPRKKATSTSQQTANLKGLRDRVNGSLQGKGPNVLGVESSH
ncbi:putative sphinganine hydroxylase protein [Neofusicoccum parvum]|uniref:Sphinganine hydroxylase protein n=2 Tax=Neofusicoccum parvum TaxID=310453 RepID=A0ACB5S7C2_9PEZI|nr:putative sphinganine hydroxylase protein [Neofusicoccum parvum UCRNP2]GME28617.1 putative sphinganine hydroxylase protein [Neofusicoccum parvum]GME58789.1 putative sphinganine hydroxylase protein [Neofusicoccum parvum]